MKKYLVLIILLIIACDSKWEDKSFTNENGNKIASYKKNIDNLELKYNFNEKSKSELLNIKNNLYVYSISKLIFDNNISLDYIKAKIDFKNSSDLIEISKDDFAIEIKELNIRDKIAKDNDDISRKVINMLDEILKETN